MRFAHLARFWQLAVGRCKAERLDALLFRPSNKCLSFFSGVGSLQHSVRNVPIHLAPVKPLPGEDLQVTRYVAMKAGGNAFQGADVGVLRFGGWTKTCEGEPSLALPFGRGRCKVACCRVLHGMSHKRGAEWHFSIHLGHPEIGGIPMKWTRVLKDYHPLKSPLVHFHDSWKEGRLPYLQQAGQVQKSAPHYTEAAYDEIELLAEAG